MVAPVVVILVVAAPVVVLVEFVASTETKTRYEVNRAYIWWLETPPGFSPGTKTDQTLSDVIYIAPA